MIVVDNTLLEIEQEEMIWEAIGVYYAFCLRQVNEGHIAADIFRKRMDQCEKFIARHMYLGKGAIIDLHKH